MASLTLAQALKIIDIALAKARADGCKPMGIAVLDESGALKAFAREDGASMFRFEIAQAKAWGAVGMGVSSRALGQRAKDNPNFFVSLAATAHGKFLPQTGHRSRLWQMGHRGGYPAADRDRRISRVARLSGQAGRRRQRGAGPWRSTISAMAMLARCGAGLPR